MNRRKFARSWGRKVFFGMGWPIFTLLGLLYFPHQIHTTDVSDIAYLFFTFIGHYGILTSILYFIFFAPVVSLLPTYYVSRLWSLLLILLTSALLILDAAIFSEYQLHLNPYFVDLIVDGRIASVLNYPQLIFGVIIGLFLFMGLFVWFRGERIWRAMQRRFSNPVKNWYLFLYTFSFVIGHVIYLGEAVGGRTTLGRFVKLYPLHWQLPTKVLAIFSLPQPTQGATNQFFYPKNELKCLKASEQNVLIVLLPPWEREELDTDLTPVLNHFISHGLRFSDHHSGGLTAQDGIYSLLYSLPATFMSETLAAEAAPAFLRELERRNYDINVLTTPGKLDANFQKVVFGKNTESNEIFTQWTNWLKERQEREITRPFFGIISFTQTQDLSAIDGYVSEVVENLLAQGLLSNTIVLITATHTDSTQVPMLTLWPDRKPQEITHFTSHYDVVPTLMKELWGCSNPFSDYSISGKSLFDKREKNWHLIGTPGSFDLLDYQQNAIFRMTKGGFSEAYDFGGAEVDLMLPREELVLSTFKEIAKFRKK